jgi:hypothetical protein
MEDMEVHTEFWWGDLMGRDRMEDPGSNWRIILKWIFNKLYGEECTRLL